MRRRRHADRIAHRLTYVPIALIEYPMELLLAAWGLISGPAALVGASYEPPEFPEQLMLTWGAVLTLAGATILFGLIRKSYALTVAPGLRLLGSGCVFGAVVLLGFVPRNGGIPAGSLVSVIALLCYFRAWWLTARQVLANRIESESVSMTDEP